MSLILDALNKADNERSKEAPPSLSSDHDLNVSRSKSPINYRLIYGLGVAVFILLVFVIYLSFNINNQNSESQKQPSHSQITENKQTSKSFKQSLLPDRNVAGIPELPHGGPEFTDRENQRTQDIDDKASDTYQIMKQKLIEAQYQQAELDSKAEEKDKTERDNVASIYQQSESKNKAKEEKIKIAQQVKPKGDKTLSDYPALSFIGELSHSIQKTIPTLMYREHVHNGSANFVTLNNNKRQKGQLVAEKIYLEEILPDGIILRFESQKFKMKALNSWVNI